MPYRVKSIKNATKPRASVTLEDTATREEWTENFNTIAKDWVGLKARFTARIVAERAVETTEADLITEAENANLADIVVP